MSFKVLIVSAYNSSIFENLLESKVNDFLINGYKIKDIQFSINSNTNTFYALIIAATDNQPERSKREDFRSGCLIESHADGSNPKCISTNLHKCQSRDAVL